MLMNFRETIKILSVTVCSLHSALEPDYCWFPPVCGLLFVCTFAHHLLPGLLVALLLSERIEDMCLDNVSFP